LGLGVGQRSVKLIVGLGNPGIEYQFTPHNIGFLAVDRIAGECGARVANRRCRALTGKCQIGGKEVLLAKPETFMNLSGMAVRELVEEFEAEPSRDLIVIYDELDLPLGTLRIRERGSSAGHNGLESVLGALETPEFTRIRLGIAPAHPVRDGAAYVLSPFKKAQYKSVDGLLDSAAEAAKVILTEGAGEAMNRFNRRVAADAGKA
jgi:PTH1 family peptidyl-tRNA hydrolase